jgi:hypothetical protein
MKKCTKCNELKTLDSFQIRSDNGKYRNECKECTSVYKKQRYFANHEHTLGIKKKYREDPANKERRRVWDKNKRDTSVNYRLRINLRNRLNRAIKKEFKVGSAVQDLGCSIEDLKIWLEQQFEPGMTWDNWGRDGWHIDHIIPLSNVDLTDEVEFKKVCHWFNLRPLWAIDNYTRPDPVR